MQPQPFRCFVYEAERPQSLHRVVCARHCLEDASRYSARHRCPLEYVGRGVVGEFLHLFFASGRRYRLVETESNGQPAFGVYVRGADDCYHATGLFVRALRAGRVSAMTRFESPRLAAFGLPRWLPD